jgi:hypothetical protein
MGAARDCGGESKKSDAKNRMAWHDGGQSSWQDEMKIAFCLKKLV